MTWGLPIARNVFLRIAFYITGVIKELKLKVLQPWP